MAIEDLTYHTRNKWTFSVGTIGRDAVYTLITGYLLVYITGVLAPSPTVFFWTATLILFMRLFDAVLDVVMGMIVDNTKSRWGHYKPWILGGVIASATFTVLLFAPIHVNNVAFVICYVLLYLFWSVSWTTNDIPYWSLLPTLSLEQKRREEIGSVAKIFAAIGQFTVAVAVVPVTDMLRSKLGDDRAWLVFAGAIVIIMIIGQSVTLIGTKVPDLVIKQPRVNLRDVPRLVFQNDQLLWTAIAMVLFMAGFTTTVNFGVYYFRYVYHNTNMYAIFAACVGVAMIVGFAVFPSLRKHFTRLQMYTIAATLMVVGYLVFFFAPLNIFILGAAAVVIFVGQSFITVLMLGFLTDTIDYGHWKFGHRNTALTFALQPFINKVGAAIAQEIVALAAIWSGIAAHDQFYSKLTFGMISSNGISIVKVTMMLLPLVLIVVGYVIYRFKYRIDEEFHAKILSDLGERGELVDDEFAAQD